MAEDHQKSSSEPVLPERKLEVETPEEARIVHDIGEQITDVVKESASGGPSSEDGGIFDEDENLQKSSFLREFSNVLATAGLSIQKLIGCLLIFLFLVGAGFFIFFRDSAVPFEKPSEKPSVTAPVPSQFLDQKFGVDTAFIFGIPDETVFESDIFDTILQLVFQQGYRGDFPDRFSEYIAHLGIAQNALSTDIFHFLDRTPHRSQALDEHLQELQNLLHVSQEMLLFIHREMAAFKAEFDSFGPLKSDAERQFFDYFENFQPDSSRRFLTLFIETSQKMVDRKAKNLALNKLRIFYEAAISKLDARIRDIQLNREALLKGVRVFDVKNSDLQIIFPEQKSLE